MLTWEYHLIRCDFSSSDHTNTFSTKAEETKVHIVNRLSTTPAGLELWAFSVRVHTDLKYCFPISNVIL